MPSSFEPNLVNHYPLADNENRCLTKREQRQIQLEKVGTHPFRTFAKAVGGLALTLTSLYSLDVAYGSEAVNDSRSAIIPVSTEPSSFTKSSATVVSAGLGNLTAYYTAAALPAYEQYGSVWAMRYSNNGINVDTIAEKLIDEANQNQITEVSFSGHSMGGLIDLGVARRIYENKGPITVPYIILDCTPASIDAVRPEVRSDGYTMARGLSIIPGARYSSAVRFIAEEAARFDQFKDRDSRFLIDPKKFVDTTKQVINDKFLRQDVASTALLESQFKFIVASGAKDDILALGKNNGKPKPILVYLRPLDPAADQTVDNDFSQAQFEEYARDAGLTLIVVKIPGIGHANPIQRPSEYNQAISNLVMAKIRLVQAIAKDALSEKLNQDTARLSEGKFPQPAVSSQAG